MQLSKFDKIDRNELATSCMNCWSSVMKLKMPNKDTSFAFWACGGFPDRLMIILRKPKQSYIFRLSRSLDIFRRLDAPSIFWETAHSASSTISWIFNSFINIQCSEFCIHNSVFWEAAHFASCPFDHLLDFPMHLRHQYAICEHNHGYYHHHRIQRWIAKFKCK